MKKLKMKVTVNNQVVFNQEDESYKSFRDAQRAMERSLWSHWQKIIAQTEGQTGAVNMGLSWECTMDRRAPKRAPDVIAAEKASRAAKARKRKLEHEQYEKQKQQEIIRLRQRIKSQVDHAFVIGKSGTEPASKYITCQHCNAPAAFLVLNQALTRGASVLDEDTIVGALCAEHSKWRGSDESVLCSRLEFFYDGIRQIAIKP
jgi:hypothetical protein